MHDILDLKRYPLDQPDSADWRALVDRCRADLSAKGMFNLEGLLRPDVAATVADQAQPRFATEAFLHEREHNIYFKPIDELAPDHPALQICKTSNQTLCGDQIAGSPVLRLYQWPELATFLAATMQKPKLHVMDDLMASVNVMAYAEGQALNWHFDRSEFTTTLLLQAPDAGGIFEYRTGLRSDHDPNYDGVAGLLQGRDPQVKQLQLAPGTLNVFKGKNTAHRVTPVKGNRQRIIAVLSYYEHAGVRFSDTERLGFYGRTS